MFEKTHTRYEVEWGQSPNDRDMGQTFKSLERALSFARKNSSPYVVVHEYRGPWDDISDYAGTHFERGAGR